MALFSTEKSILNRVAKTFGDLHRSSEDFCVFCIISSNERSIATMGQFVVVEDALMHNVGIVEDNTIFLLEEDSIGSNVQSLDMDLPLV